MEQRKSDASSIRQSKSKFNRLLDRYREQKNKLAMEAAKIRNMQTEITRLSDRNHEILRNKHDVEQEAATLRITKQTLMLQINTHERRIHNLETKNVQ